MHPFNFTSDFSTPDFLNRFSFPLEVQEIRIPLCLCGWDLNWAHVSALQEVPAYGRCPQAKVYLCNDCFSFALKLWVMLRTNPHLSWSCVKQLPLYFVKMYSIFLKFLPFLHKLQLCLVVCQTMESFVEMRQLLCSMINWNLVYHLKQNDCEPWILMQKKKNTFLNNDNSWDSYVMFNSFYICL